MAEKTTQQRACEELSEAAAIVDGVLAVFTAPSERGANDLFDELTDVKEKLIAVHDEIQQRPGDGGILSYRVGGRDHKNWLAAKATKAGQ